MLGIEGVDIVLNLERKPNIVVRDRTGTFSTTTAPLCILGPSDCCRSGFACRLLRLSKQKPRRRTKAARPAMTPPAIAPVLDLLDPPLLLPMPFEFEPLPTGALEEIGVCKEVSGVV